jgi:hypothetical protein
VASRLYRTTRPLYLQVTRTLDRLGIATIGSPTTVALIALYVTGLILLDARPTQTRLARFLPGRCHDALNRLLRTSPLSTRSLRACWSPGSLARACPATCAWMTWWLRRPSPSGCAGPDGPTRSPRSARSTACTSWWCCGAASMAASGSRWRLRLWRPKRSCAPGAYQTKLQLAAQMLTELVAARLPFQYLVTDTHDTAGWFTRLAGRLGICWVGTLPPKTTVIWRGRRQSAAELAERLRLAWRPRLGLRAAAVTVYAPTYGPLRLVVTRNRHGNLEPVVTSDLGADLNRVVERKHSRWSVETIFRDTKQYTGLGACQCYTDAAMVRHVGLVLLGFVVLQHLRTHPSESLPAVKERWQLTLTHQGRVPPKCRDVRFMSIGCRAG